MSSSSQSLISAADQNAARAARFARRKRVNRIALSLSLLAMVFGVFWLVWILWETLRLGLGGDLRRADHRPRRHPGSAPPVPTSAPTHVTRPHLTPGG